MPCEADIILASGSPRRRELIERLGLTYRIIAPDVDETAAGTPAEMVAELSERKARVVCAGLEPQAGVVLAADTLVALDGIALGKPQDEADARRMLRSLSGRAHQVLTGVCMIDAATGAMRKCVETTVVRFRELRDGEIEAYIATGEPMDKAGAYGIQGGAGAFVEWIEGSYANVMGLPSERIIPMMKSLKTGA